MDKSKKYKFVFESASKFLNNIITKYPALNDSILKKHLEPESTFENIMDAHRQLIKSLTSRNMMHNVIGFDQKEKEMEEILFGYDPTKILSAYKNADELLDKFRRKFNLQNVQNKRSLWYKFSESIISGSVFMASFKDKPDFDSFINTFAHNKYTKAALPMLISEEIKGFGFALACDFLKKLGYKDYPKPDVHLIKIFYSLGLSPSNKPYEVYKSIVEMSEIVEEDAYTVDRIFWLISSGNFYLVNINTGKNRDKFIKSVKLDLERAFVIKR